MLNIDINIFFVVKICGDCAFILKDLDVWLELNSN